VRLADHPHPDAERFQPLRRAVRVLLLPGGDDAHLQARPHLRRREADQRVGRPAVAGVDPGNRVQDAHQVQLIVVCRLNNRRLSFIGGTSGRHVRGHVGAAAGRLSFRSR
jgi:hypothetical protein